MTPRRRLSVDDVLCDIGHMSPNGRRLRATAARVIDLAVSLGAQPRKRQEGIALRLPGPVNSKPDWLTLFVLSTSGTIYNNWEDRWRKAGVPARAINKFRSDMTKTLGPEFFSHPSARKRAPDLNVVRKQWTKVETIISRAAATISAAVAQTVREDGNPPGHELPLEALEGQLIEYRMTRRGRSATLRRKAMALSNGRCEACRMDYSKVLGGRGWRVLQVHHRDQLSDLDAPKVSKVEDLSIICANCHLLIHTDRSGALPVQALRAQLERDKSRKRR